MRFPYCRHNTSTYCLAAGFVAIWAATLTGATPPDPVAVQTMRFAVRPRLASDSPPVGGLTLWYTRDRGKTWQRAASAEAGQDSIVFEAPAEGLYGLYVAAGGAAAPGPGPVAGAQPHRWIYVDCTPPLVQWKNVELLADPGGARRVAMTWAVYDANLDSRPISLACQPAGQTHWTTIDAAVANTGRYDWLPPADLRGRVTFRLTVRDLGAHTVERLFGPISLDEARVVQAERPTTQPATQPTMRETRQAGPPAPPRVEVMGPVDPARQEQARRLYQQATWHRDRGQYADAQERLLEALQLDPALLPARTDLAGVLYSRGLYAEAVEQYRSVLQDDPARATALRGLALAYVAGRDYAAAREALERLLLRDEKNAEAWLDLGDVAWKSGDRAAARAHWTKACGVDPAAGDVILKARNRLSLFRPDAETPQATEGR